MQFKESLDMDSIRMEVQGLKLLSKKARAEAVKLANKIHESKEKVTLEQYEEQLGYTISESSEEAEMKCKKLGNVLDEFIPNPNWMWQLYKRADDCGLVGSWSKTIETGALLKMTSEYHGFNLVFCLALDKLHAEMWAIVDGANIRYTCKATARWWHCEHMSST